MRKIDPKNIARTRKELNALAKGGTFSFDEIWKAGVKKYGARGFLNFLSGLPPKAIFYAIVRVDHNPDFIEGCHISMSEKHARSLVEAMRTVTGKCRHVVLLKLEATEILESFTQCPVGI